MHKKILGFVRFCVTGGSKISKNFILVQLSGWPCLGFGKWKLSCWGCQKGQCSGTSLDFAERINENYSFFGIF